MQNRNKIMAIFKESMHCVNTLFHSQILHLFQFADEMPNSHIYKFSQNNLYSHNVIAGCTKLRNENEIEHYMQPWNYKGRSPYNGKLSDFSFYIDSQISVHRKFKK
jgi:hypothetical protein